MEAPGPSTIRSLHLQISLLVLNPSGKLSLNKCLLRLQRGLSHTHCHTKSEPPIYLFIFSSNLETAQGQKTCGT